MKKQDSREPDPDDIPPFRVETDGDAFKVADREGKGIVTSSAAANAEHYAALLNEAYRRGYKAGYRNAKRLNRE